MIEFRKANSFFLFYFHCNFKDVEPVDFARTQETANIINAWCANATNNHIKNIVSPGLFPTSSSIAKQYFSLK